MKKIFVFAALASVLMFTACENQAPFDTQTADDAPLILKPYNESGTGSFTYLLANPDTPLLDSVTVTPSHYTTVNWYLDGELIYTGFRIEMCFPVGKYALTIEAVTTAGKRTERTGSVTVNPYDNDPSSPYPAAGRHCVPNVEMTIDGQNLTKVKNVLFTRDIFGKNIAYAVAPSDKNGMQGNNAGTAIWGLVAGAGLNLCCAAVPIVHGDYSLASNGLHLFFLIAA